MSVLRNSSSPRAERRGPVFYVSWICSVTVTVVLVASLDRAGTNDGTTDVVDVLQFLLIVLSIVVIMMQRWSLTQTNRTVNSLVQAVRVLQDRTERRSQAADRLSISPTSTLLFCGCKHNYAFHDLEAGKCRGLATSVASGVVGPRCGCVRYTGVVPPTDVKLTDEQRQQIFAEELLKGEYSHDGSPVIE